MGNIREAIEGYCEHQAHYDCERCALYAACTIANPQAKPENMSNRDIDILFNNATHMCKELEVLIESVEQNTN